MDSIYISAAIDIDPLLPQLATGHDSCSEDGDGLTDSRRRIRGFNPLFGTLRTLNATNARVRDPRVTTATFRHKHKVDPPHQFEAALPEYGRPMALRVRRGGVWRPSLWRCMLVRRSRGKREGRPSATLIGFVDHRFGSRSVLSGLKSQSRTRFTIHRAGAASR